MLLNSNVDVFAKSNVKSASGIPDNVDAIKAPRVDKKLVAGAGFEPAVPQTRDYEPNRDKPIIL